MSTNEHDAGGGLTPVGETYVPDMRAFFTGNVVSRYWGASAEELTAAARKKTTKKTTKKKPAKKKPAKKKPARKKPAKRKPARRPTAGGPGCVTDVMTCTCDCPTSGNTNNNR